MPTVSGMTGHGRVVAGLLTSTALAAGLLLGAAGSSSADPGGSAVTVDRPDPKERTRPGDRPDPRCDRAQQGLDAAKANVAQARQRLKAAPKKKKAARKKQLQAAKQTRSLWKTRVSTFC